MHFHRPLDVNTVLFRRRRDCVGIVDDDLEHQAHWHVSTVLPNLYPARACWYDCPMKVLATTQISFRQTKPLREEICHLLRFFGNSTESNS
jgi:hypothetical protein